MAFCLTHAPWWFDRSCINAAKIIRSHSRSYITSWLPRHFLFCCCCCWSNLHLKGSGIFLLALNYRDIFRLDVFTHHNKQTKKRPTAAIIICWSDFLLLLATVAHRPSIKYFYLRVSLVLVASRPPNCFILSLTYERDVSNWWTKVKFMHANVIRKLCDLYLDAMFQHYVALFIATINVNCWCRFGYQWLPWLIRIIVLTVDCRPRCISRWIFQAFSIHQSRTAGSHIAPVKYENFMQFHTCKIYRNVSNTMIYLPPSALLERALHAVVSVFRFFSFLAFFRMETENNDFIIYLISRKVLLLLPVFYPRVSAGLCIIWNFSRKPQPIGAR